ncbi:MAG: hypothetical protein AAB111_07705, partial [Nitrospirota bacterium]
MTGRNVSMVSVVMLGLVMILSQGCGMKWLQSDGEVSSAQSDKSKNWNGEGVNPNFPGMAHGGASGELRGFSQNPDEERLAQSGYRASLNPSDVTVRRRAELT